MRQLSLLACPSPGMCVCLFPGSIHLQCSSLDRNTIQSAWQEASLLLPRLLPLPFPTCLMCLLPRVLRQLIGFVVAGDWRSCSGNTAAFFCGLWGGA